MNAKVCINRFNKYGKEKTRWGSNALNRPFGVSLPTSINPLLSASSVSSQCAVVQVIFPVHLQCRCGEEFSCITANSLVRTLQQGSPQVPWTRKFSAFQNLLVYAMSLLRWHKRAKFYHLKNSIEWNQVLPLSGSSKNTSTLKIQKSFLLWFW